ncbi:hypothetical protein [Parasphingorhabdus sp.]|jgi:hypothetical protein|uniref:hypothetical protein n=1 Tax=Parasphingorhabdus sp. TaxID=2709688 RepID=UPI003D2864CE
MTGIADLGEINLPLPKWKMSAVAAIADIRWSFEHLNIRWFIMHTNYLIFHEEINATSVATIQKGGADDPKIGAISLFFSRFVAE